MDDRQIMLLYLYVLIYFFIFSFFATRYNKKITTINSLKKLFRMKGAKIAAINAKIAEIEKEIIKTKKRSYIVLTLCFVAHTIHLSMVSYRSFSYIIQITIIVFASTFLLMLVLYWLKGASVMPSSPDDDKPKVFL